MSADAVGVLREIRDFLRSLVGKEPQEAEFPQPETFISSTHTPNSDASLNTTRSQILNEGTLLSTNVTIASGAPTVGRVHVRVVLEDSAQREIHTICMGYVYPGHEIFGSGSLVIRKGDFIRLDSRSSQASVGLQVTGRILKDKKQAGGWAGVMKGSLEGPGWSRILNVTNPAAGAEFSQAVPTNTRWKVKIVRFTFAASSQAASREPELFIDDGTNDVARIPATVSMAASATKVHIYSQIGTAAFAGAVRTTLNVPLPNDLLLFAGHRVITNTEAIKTLDQYSTIYLLLEQWVEE